MLYYVIVCVYVFPLYRYSIQSDSNLLIALMPHMRAHTQCTIYEVFSRIILHNCSFLINLGKSLCLIPCLLICLYHFLSLFLFLSFSTYYLSFAVSFPLLYTCLKKSFLFTPQNCLIYSCSSLRVNNNKYTLKRCIRRTVR